MSEFQVLAVDSEAGGKIVVEGQFLVPYRAVPDLPARVIVLRLGKHRIVMIQRSIDPSGSFGEFPRTVSCSLGTFLLSGGKVSSFEVLDLALAYFEQLKAYRQIERRFVPARVLFNQAIQAAEEQCKPK